jgi:hypothetical protein
LITECFFLLVPEGFSYIINWNNYNSNWKKLLGFRKSYKIFVAALKDLFVFSIPPQRGYFTAKQK